MNRLRRVRILWFLTSAGIMACGSEGQRSKEIRAITPSGQQVLLAASDLVNSTTHEIAPGTQVVRDAAGDRFVGFQPGAEFALTFSCTEGCRPYQIDQRFVCGGADVCGSVLGYALYEANSRQSSSSVPTEGDLAARHI